MKKLVNLLPYDVGFFSKDQTETRIPKEETPARFNANRFTSDREVIDLPEPQENTIFIVDRNIYWHLKGVRSDLIYPAGLIFENEEPIGFITLD